MQVSEPSLFLAAGKPSEGRGASLEDAAREFEALLLHQFLRDATESVAGQGILDRGAGARLYRDLFHQSVARAMAQRGTFGLAKLLERGAAPEAAREER